jgi:Kazal-type serine protease inhibitor domain
MLHKLLMLAGGAVVALACAATSVDAAKVGERCEGFVGIHCDRGLWCDPDSGKCGWADWEGTCRRIGQVCYQLYRPVCGCDGRTYTNDCYRIRSKAAKNHDGKC